MTMNDAAIARVRLLDEIVRCAAPVLKWDTEKADVWLPGLKAALGALRDAEVVARAAPPLRPIRGETTEKE